MSLLHRSSLVLVLLDLLRMILLQFVSFMLELLRYLSMILQLMFSLLPVFLSLSLNCVNQGSVLVIQLYISHLQFLLYFIDICKQLFKRLLLFMTLLVDDPSWLLMVNALYYVRFALAGNRVESPSWHVAILLGARGLGKGHPSQCK